MKRQQWVMAVVLVGIFSMGAWASDEVVITAVDDVSVGEAWPDGNRSGSSILYTNLYYAGSEIWLKFDLSSLVPPEGCSLQVDSAKLLSSGSNAGDVLPIYQDAAWFCAEDSWNEGTITWNNRPAVLGAQLVTPWDYVPNAGFMEATGPDLATCIEQEVMGDHLLSMMVNGTTPVSSGSFGHYYHDNDYSNYGFRLVVGYTIAQKVTIPASEDVSVGEAWPDANRSGSSYLYTNRYYAGSEIWLKFDLSSLVPPQGYRLQVNSAKLLSSGSNAGDVQPTYQDAAWFCADDSWNEGTITWNNRPGVLGAQLVPPWDYSTTSEMEASGTNLAALVQQEVMGDHSLSMMVTGITPPTSGTVGHYYHDNDYSNYGFRLAVGYSFVPGSFSLILPGDANLDGRVDVGDLGILAANYGHSGKTWAQGDFNGDGAVDVGDLGILAANYGTGTSNANWDADYVKAFGATLADDSANDETGSTLCSRLGLPLIAGLALMGSMLMKLEE